MNKQLLERAADLARRGESFVFAVVVRREPYSSSQQGDSAIITADSVVMTRAYGWALISPERKLRYNLAITAVSVVVALFIGGLEALGLGPQDKPTLGMTIFWAIYYGATLRGMWWWWGPPIVVLVIVFVALFSIAQGLDRYTNPRLRRTT